jgi:hypothetical protein
MTRTGVDGAVFITVFRCECGKIHCCAGVGQASVCACGRNLWRQVWEAGR